MNNLDRLFIGIRTANAAAAAASANAGVQQVLANQQAGAKDAFILDQIFNQARELAAAKTLWDQRPGQASVVALSWQDFCQRLKVGTHNCQTLEEKNLFVRANEDAMEILEQTTARLGKSEIEEIREAVVMGKIVHPLRDLIIWKKVRKLMKGGGLLWTQSAWKKILDMVVVCFGIFSGIFISAVLTSTALEKSRGAVSLFMLCLLLPIIGYFLLPLSRRYFAKEANKVLAEIGYEISWQSEAWIVRARINLLEENLRALNPDFRPCSIERLEGDLDATLAAILDASERFDLGLNLEAFPRLKSLAKKKEASQRPLPLPSTQPENVSVVPRKEITAAGFSGNPRWN